MKTNTIITRQSGFPGRIALFAATLMVLFGLAAAIPRQAEALTESEATAICAILSCSSSQRAALSVLVVSGTNTGTGSVIAYDFGAATMRQGSSGFYVRNLQMFLNQFAGANLTVDGIYGPNTRARVAGWQALSGIASDGVFGPQSRTVALAAISRANDSSVPVPPADDDDDDDDDTQTLSGGAGSISDYTIVNRYSNEEVGEGQEDVIVAALEIEADNGSDIRIGAVRLSFAPGTADDDDFEDYADEVSLLLGDEEVARIDDDWSGLTILDPDAIIRAGDTETLYIAVSGAGNIDSDQFGDTWTVDYRTIRWEDAQGAILTEDPGTSPVTFSFESFATASSAELRISPDDDDINRSRIITISQSDETDDEEILSFSMEARGNSDIWIDSIPVRFDVGGGATDVGEVIRTAYLLADGDEIASESFDTGIGADETVVFEDLDITIDEGEKVSFTVAVDIAAIEDGIEEGATIAARITETETDLSSFEAEDESGEELTDADKTGQVVGDEHALFSAGIEVSFESASQTIQANDGANNDTGTFTIRFTVEALEETVYIADSAAPTTDDTIPATVTDDGIIYSVERSGTLVSDTVSDIVIFTTGDGASESANGNIRLDAGESTTITLVTNRTNSASGDTGIYRAFLQAIGWNTDDSNEYSTYTFDLDDFATDPITLN